MQRTSSGRRVAWLQYCKSDSAVECSRVQCSTTEAVIEGERRAEHVVRRVEAHAAAGEVRVVHYVVVR